MWLHLTGFCAGLARNEDANPSEAPLVEQRLAKWRPELARSALTDFRGESICPRAPGLRGKWEKCILNARWLRWKTNAPIGRGMLLTDLAGLLSREISDTRRESNKDVTGAARESSRGRVEIPVVPHGCLPVPPSKAP